MTRATRTTRSRPRRGRGFSLVEAVVSIAIVGGMLVVALNTAGAARFGQYKMSQRGRGMLLAQDIMTEILNQAYVEPVDKPTFGPETAEGSRSRAMYDDADDYHLWSASPPQYKDGTARADLKGWERKVWVRWVPANDFKAVAGSDTGMKRIEVEVYHNALLAARLWAVRSDNDQQDDE